MEAEGTERAGNIEALAEERENLAKRLKEAEEQQVDIMPVGLLISVTQSQLMFTYLYALGGTIRCLFPT
jgi:hypothetical protein